MIWVDAPNLDISSSLIRKNVATGNSIRYLVPESVRLYIESRGLYRD
jgi:nicotinate-nucleotide adenylyltransferase